MLLTFERPPMQSTQIGLSRHRAWCRSTTRGSSWRTSVASQLARADAGRHRPSGRRRREVYENVQVLGDLSADEFIRLMAAITEWVLARAGLRLLPQRRGDLAADDAYTKVVAAADAADDAARSTPTGRTTSRRPASPATPATAASRAAEHLVHRAGAAGDAAWSADRQGQNLATRAVGLTSLPNDPF